MAKKGAIVGADQLVTHSHLHRHAGGHFNVWGEGNGVVDHTVDLHGHWHPHDARDKERHEHKHSALDLWPHDGCAVEKLPPALPKVAGADKPKRGKKAVAAT